MAGDAQPKEEDVALMRLALREAARGVGLTSPNPPVGCVIANNGRVLEKGWHRKAGAAHAEPAAIAAVRRRFGLKSDGVLRGASLYVTLEPCSTTGRTPACTSAIVAEGIGRVVHAAVDPNPDHAGAAGRILRAKGISVTTGLLQAEAKLLLRPFSKWITTGPACPG